MGGVGFTYLAEVDDGNYPAERKPLQPKPADSNLNKITIDFETRSAKDIKHGAWAYAEDPTTEVLCLAIKFNEEPTRLFAIDHFADEIPESEFDGVIYRRGSQENSLINRLVAEADTIEAHNVGFEMAIWHHVMVNRYGYDPIPTEKWRCSAAKASVCALPRALDKCGAALGLDVQKDGEGKKIMMRMCKPRAPKKAEVKKLTELGYTINMNSNGTAQKLGHVDILGEPRYFWHETPEDIVKLCKYCIQDVEAEHAISAVLPDLSPSEQELFKYDLIINQRGIPSDVESISTIREKVDAYKDLLDNEFRALTGGIGSGQRVKVMAYLEALGVPLAGYTAADINGALQEVLDPTARRLLEIRQSVSKSSTKKLDAFVNCSNSDGRVRFGHVYHKATTGRWGGSLIQPQNFPRPAKGYNADEGIPDFGLLDTRQFVEKHGDIMAAASSSLRGLIKASPGKKFLCADYASIEGRVLAWLAGEEKTLQAYREGKDMYKAIASEMFSVPYDEIDDTQRQAGKIGELAFGYQGGGKAYVQFAEQFGMDCTQALGETYKNQWRKARPFTVAYWKTAENAARNAIKFKGQYFDAGPVKFVVDGRWLNAILPSGRKLYYFDPSLRAGKWSPEIRFWGVNSMTNQWQEQGTYGGKLVENLTQAVARDLLAHSIPNVEKAGFPIVMGIHDELLCEVPDDPAYKLDDLMGWMAYSPAWAEGIPVEADGWPKEGSAYRFRK